MKKSILTIAFTIAILNMVFAQWQTMGTMPLKDSSQYSYALTNSYEGLFINPGEYLLPITIHLGSDTTKLYRLYKTNNFGASWQFVSSGNYPFGNIVRANTNTLIAGSRYISRNNGTTWDTIHNNIEAPQRQLTCFDSVCFAQGEGYDYQKLYKSTNFCKTWTKINDSITVSPKGFQALDANTIIRTRNGSTLNCRFFISENAGNSWTCRTNVPLYGQDPYFYFVDKNIGYLYSFARLYKTNDGGINWDTINQGPLNHMNRVYFYNENLGFTIAGMIRKTIDGGKTWIDQGPALNPRIIKCINDTVCWTLVGQNNVDYQVYYTLNQGGAPILLPPTIGLFENKQSFLAGFSLYPNPTDNGNFQIRWNAEKLGMAAVSVFDIFGRLVHQTSLQVTQTGTQDFDVNMNAKTGMYIIRVEQDGKMATKSFLVK
jgi:photosystem II stability/assembly factor-like uncharacterized protein